MSDPSQNEAVILPADHSLKNKLGPVDLDKILTPQVIEKAETVIADAADTFYLDAYNESGKLKLLVQQLSGKPKDGANLLAHTVAAAFAIKTKAAQSGRDLVAELAKSLHLFCEEWGARPITEPALKIIRWHEESIRQLLVANVTGQGGEIGKNILSEIRKLRGSV